MRRCEPWATQHDLDSIHCEGDAVDADVWLEAASDLLWIRTGRIWSGECQETVRPYGLGHQTSSEGWLGDWACMCESHVFTRSVVRLPHDRVSAATVVLDGATLIEGVDFRIDNGRDLRRLNGVWPSCQNFAVSGTAPGGWQITYTYGEPPPTAGRLAAAALACELMGFFAGDEDCKLPATVQQVSRQNVSVVLSSLELLLEDGSTGIKLVDSFVKSVNPHGVARRPRLRSPDDPRFGR